MHLNLKINDDTLILPTKALRGSTGRTVDKFVLAGWLLSANVNDTAQYECIQLATTTVLRPLYRSTWVSWRVCEEPEDYVKVKFYYLHALADIN